MSAEKTNADIMHSGIGTRDPLRLVVLTTELVGIKYWIQTYYTHCKKTPHFCGKIRAAGTQGLFCKGKGKSGIMASSYLEAL